MEEKAIKVLEIIWKKRNAYVVLFNSKIPKTNLH